MSRDKQIVEMAKYIQEATNFAVQKLFVETKAFIAEYHRYHSVKDFDKAHGKNLNELEAEYLIDKGYRKASDVALETVDSFQRILRHIFLNMCDGNDYERLNLLQIDGAIEALYDSFIAELKKKYESEGEG